jgi:hypothetical protein
VPVAAWVGFGVGAAGLVLGAITGGLSLAAEGRLADSCGPDKICSPADEDSIDGGMLMANLSNVGFAVGGAGAVFGLIALFALKDDKAPAEGAAARLLPLVGPTGLGLAGSF